MGEGEGSCEGKGDEWTISKDGLVDNGKGGEIASLGHWSELGSVAGRQQAVITPIRMWTRKVGSAFPPRWGPVTDYYIIIIIIVIIIYYYYYYSIIIITIIIIILLSLLYYY